MLQLLPLSLLLSLMFVLARSLTDTRVYRFTPDYLILLIPSTPILPLGEFLEMSIFRLSDLLFFLHYVILSEVQIIV